MCTYKFMVDKPEPRRLVNDNFGYALVVVYKMYSAPYYTVNI